MGFEHRIKFGLIQKPHGLQGFVKVQALTDFADERFVPGQRCSLLLKGEAKDLEIEEIRPQGNLILVRFKDLGTVESVQALRNSYLYLPEDEERLDLDDNEFYEDELVGMDLCQAGEKIGEIRQLLSGPAHPLISFRKNGQEVLVPFVSQIVHSVDRENRIVVISDSYAI